MGLLFLGTAIYNGSLPFTVVSRGVELVVVTIDGDDDVASLLLHLLI